MSTITCEIAVRRASAQLVDLLPADDRIVLEDHLVSCGQCSRLMDQLRTTIALLRNRPGIDVPDVLRNSLPTRMIPGVPITCATCRSCNHWPSLFYPGFSDAPDAGSWIDPPVAWRDTYVLQPDEEFVTTEAYGVVDGALGELDPTDRSVLTLVDIEGVPFRQAATVLDLTSCDAGDRLARARSRCVARSITASAPDCNASQTPSRCSRIEAESSASRGDCRHLEADRRGTGRPD